MDGCTPTQIRYKTKVVTEIRKHEDLNQYGVLMVVQLNNDGSSSDCVLKPVRVYPIPLEENSSIVLCEVYNVDDTPHNQIQGVY